MEKFVLYRKELLKGSTETILLSVLSVQPMYGYQLVKEISGKSSGYLNFKEGTLYPALHRLEKDKYLTGYWDTSKNGQKRRYYKITALGQRRLVSMLSEWNEFSQAINLIAQPQLFKPN
ncbi:MAG: PadR family transcriptional regulator [SAR202 cluster bacterium]|nr:PadR family transcriptional regulator [SAR202 cluster bacterium]|tara:strand:- start:147 stop:503 length:357 start_codon:yes stop_codon:yes gene_type:complete